MLYMEKLSKIKPVSRTQMVIDSLVDSIISGDLKDGELLPPEGKLCEIFGVSRSILREAMHVLSAKGLVEVKQGYGTIVQLPKDTVPEEAFSNYFKFNEISLIHLLELRKPLEVEIARLAAERATDQQIRQLSDLLERFNTPGQDMESYVEVDDNFHAVLSEATQNPTFGIIMRSIISYLHFSRELTINRFGKNIVYKEHMEIFNGVKNHDPEAAMTAMAHHINSVAEHLREIQRAKTDGADSGNKETVGT